VCFTHSGCETGRKHAREAIEASAHRPRSRIRRRVAGNRSVSLANRKDRYKEGDSNAPNRCSFGNVFGRPNILLARRFPSPTKGSSSDSRAGIAGITTQRQRPGREDRGVNRTFMKFTAPILTPAKSAALQRTKAWLINLMSDLESKESRLDELNIALASAQARQAAAEKNAAVDPDAALALAGAEAQLSRLAPEVKRLQECLQRDAHTGTHQASLVRTTEVRELIFGHLVEQLNAKMTDAISPFFAPDWARQHARRIMQESNPWRRLMFYANRKPVVTDDLAAAKQEIKTVVDEVTQILAGETLFEA
jgi:hypothetical protein